MMNWQSFDQFLHMGGYGLYVWGSYAVTLAVMLAEVALVRRRRSAAFAAARAETLRETNR
jgi:heme exporter protein D